MKAFTLVNPSMCRSLANGGNCGTAGKLPFWRTFSPKSIYTGNHHYISSEFRHTSKNFEGGLPKHILEKNTVFWKKGCRNMGV
jgi:hypothetical protein